MSSVLVAWHGAVQSVARARLERAPLPRVSHFLQAFEERARRREQEERGQRATESHMCARRRVRSDPALVRLVSIQQVRTAVDSHANAQTITAHLNKKKKKIMKKREKINASAKLNTKH